MTNPKTKHWSTAKRVSTYVIGTIDFGILQGKSEELYVTRKVKGKGGDKSFPISKCETEGIWLGNSTKTFASCIHTPKHFQAGSTIST
jgi:hypothetical protein